MVNAEALLREAEEQIEAWWCDLDRAWARILADAEDEAAEIVAAARREAAEILRRAETEPIKVRAIAYEQVDAEPESAVVLELAPMRDQLPRKRGFFRRLLRRAA